MNENKLIVNFSDGTKLIGFYEPNTDLISKWLISEKELIETYKNKIDEWDKAMWIHSDEQQDFLLSLSKLDNTEDVEIYYEYTNTWYKSKADKKRQVIDSSSLLDCEVFVPENNETEEVQSSINVLCANSNPVVMTYYQKCLRCGSLLEYKMKDTQEIKHYVRAINNYESIHFIVCPICNTNQIASLKYKLSFFERLRINREKKRLERKE